MRKFLLMMTVAGVALVAGTTLAVAQQSGSEGVSAGSGASGTTGDMNAPQGTLLGGGGPQESPSDAADAMSSTGPSAGTTPAAGDATSGTTTATTGGSSGTMPASGAVRSTTEMAREMPASGRNRPCFPAAWEFDQRLKAMLGPDATGPGGFERATEMRNQGMEACNAGRVQEGRRMIEEATAALRG